VAVAAQAGQNLFGARGAVTMRDDDARAMLGKNPSRSCADATAASRYQRYLFTQRAHLDLRLLVGHQRLLLRVLGHNRAEAGRTLGTSLA